MFESRPSCCDGCGQDTVHKIVNRMQKSLTEMRQKHKKSLVKGANDHSESVEMMLFANKLLLYCNVL